MSDSRATSGHPGQDSTTLQGRDDNGARENLPSLNPMTAYALDEFPSELSDDARRLCGQPPASVTTNRGILAFDVDPPVQRAPVVDAWLQAARRRPRSGSRRVLTQSARRAYLVAMATAGSSAVGVSRRILPLASRLQLRLRRLAHWLAAAIPGVASEVVAAVFRRIDRVPRSRPLAASATLSLVAVVATFDGLAQMRATFGPKPGASGVLVSDAIEPVALSSVRTNTVAPFERLRNAVDPMRPPSRSPSTMPRPDAAPTDHGRSIQAVLNRYRDALSILDVAAIRDVWPSVDIAALRNGFARVVEQNVEFDACRISTTGVRATASCVGVLESGLNPGRRRPRSEKKRWQFTLHKSGARWSITNVSAQPL